MDINRVMKAYKEWDDEQAKYLIVIALQSLEHGDRAKQVLAFGDYMLDCMEKFKTGVKPLDND